MDNETAFLFNWRDEFDDIRSLHQDEVPAAVQKLLGSEDFSGLLKAKAGEDLYQRLETILHSLDSIEAFQQTIKTFLLPLIKKTFARLRIEGLDQLPKDQAYIFISNHHDILMDPLLVNLSLLEHELETAHCAIGDNLLQGNSAALLAGLNRCFTVKRSLSSPKAMLKAMRLQSEYINYLHFNEQGNIWIAQKEGRSKDNIDKTNPALIKMLMLGKPKATATDDFLDRQNIVPVAISYEWDPCDVDKARQLIAEESDAGYTRQKGDDLKAMEKGIFDYKGEIVIRFGQPLRSTQSAQLNRYEVANQIDAFIAQNTEVYAVNLAALGLLEEPIMQAVAPDQFGLTDTELQEAKQTLTKRLADLDDSIRQRVLKNYGQIYLNRFPEHQR